jgi:hypothetical protein
MIQRRRPVRALRGLIGQKLALQLGRVSREDIKTTRVLRHRFVYFMCLRLLEPKYALDVGGRCHCAAAGFLFADGPDIFTIRRGGKNQKDQNGLLSCGWRLHEKFRVLYWIL